MFFLAQVHGQAGDRAASAAYCAATLNRQARQPGAFRAAVANALNRLLTLQL